MAQRIEATTLWKYPDEAANRLSPQVLAYVGDAVFELYARCRLAGSKLKMDRMHGGVVGMVSAKAMAEHYKKLEPHLTETEADVLHRGRNAKTRHSKSAGVGQYHMSTGFEALVGYLFLSRQEDRLGQLLSYLLDEEDESTESR